ncbi:MAG: D-alanyl-lipoteichoic acid biosynthesis protein DltD [Clostridiales Family XIII bacterium]|nr:D-alanyl-lipoteichoic acid biosynthesis protein DltD [Clostridiales Family XIII bacterium]
MEKDYRAKVLRYYGVLDSMDIDGDGIGPVGKLFVGSIPVLFANDRLVSVPIAALRKAENAENSATLTSGWDSDRKPAEQTGWQEVSDRKLFALERIIELCQSKNVTPVLFTVPYTSYYTQGVPEEKNNEFYRIVEEMVLKYGVKYYDYSRDPRFADRPELFRDYDHLNKYGAAAFTAILFEELEELRPYTKA